MFAWTCVSSVVPLSRSKNLSLPQLRSPNPPLRHPPNLANETNSPGPSFWVSVWAAVAGSRGSPSQKIDGSCKDTDRPTAVAISSDKRGKCRQRREGSVVGRRRKDRGRIWQFLCLEIDMASKARAHYAIIQGRGPRKGRQPQKTKTFCIYIFIMLK